MVAHRSKDQGDAGRPIAGGHLRGRGELRVMRERRELARRRWKRSVLRAFLRVGTDWESSRMAHQSDRRLHIACRIQMLLRHGCMTDVSGFDCVHAKIEMDGQRAPDSSWKRYRRTLTRSTSLHARSFRVASDVPNASTT